MGLENPYELSADFRYVLDAIEKEQKNLFITGRAGTGKSTLLQLFRNTTRKKVVVLAPTGIAALNVKGQTIHSFFGFPPRFLHQSDIKKRRNRKLYKNLEVLVIDEISMVRADMLDYYKRHRKCFGQFGQNFLQGVQPSKGNSNNYSIVLHGSRCIFSYKFFL